MSKILIFLTVAVLLAAGLWWYLQDFAPDDANNPDEIIAEHLPEETRNDDSELPRDGNLEGQPFAWFTEPGSSFSSTWPAHILKVRFGDTVYVLNDYLHKGLTADGYLLGCNTGNSSTLNSSSLIFQEGTAGGMLFHECYWGGGGNQFGIFQEGERYVVKHRTTDELGGAGTFETLFTVPDIF